MNHVPFQVQSRDGGHRLENAGLEVTNFVLCHVQEGQALQRPHRTRNGLELAAFQVEVLEGRFEAAEAVVGEGEVVAAQLEGLQPQRDESVVGQEYDLFRKQFVMAIAPKSLTVFYKDCKLFLFETRSSFLGLFLITNLHLVIG